jgi:hypothetical protein
MAGVCTGLGFGTSMSSGVGDLYTRAKKLQQQLDFLTLQEEYIKDEQKHLKREFLRAQEEVFFKFFIIYVILLLFLGEKNPIRTFSYWTVFRSG